MSRKLDFPTADKALGQHFLVNPGVVDKIVSLVRTLASPQSKIIEIGPGPGVLTEALLKVFPSVGAIEIDARMRAHLEERFDEEISQGKFQVLHQDALKVESLSRLGITEKDDVVLVGNLPYNVGTRILFHFLESFPSVRGFCVMLQKEVTDRLRARVGDDAYGIPSVKCALLCDHFDSFNVSPGSFKPPPKVDSAVIRFRRRKELDDREKELLASPLRYAEFFDCISRAFSKRRKMLKATFPRLKTEAVGQQRPEELSLSDWLGLYFAGQLAQ